MLPQYDVTRKLLLRGREDMLALAAAQLLHKAKSESRKAGSRRIWVDVRETLSSPPLETI